MSATEPQTEPATPPIEEMVSLEDAAKQLGIKESTLLWRIQHHKIASAVRISGRWHMSKADMERQPRPKRDGTAATTGRPEKRKYTKRSAEAVAIPPRQEELTDAISQETTPFFETGYALGRVERELEILADSLGLPKAELTARVGQLLQEQARGRGMGPSN